MYLAIFDPACFAGEDTEEVFRNALSNDVVLFAEDETGILEAIASDCFAHEDRNADEYIVYVPTNVVIETRLDRGN